MAVAEGMARLRSLPAAGVDRVAEEEHTAGARHGVGAGYFPSRASTSRLTVAEVSSRRDTRVLKVTLA